LSLEQASILRQYKRRFILFDNEKIAQKQAEDLANWLAAFPGHTEVITGIKSDPGELSQGKADRIMRELQLGRYDE